MRSLLSILLVMVSVASVYAQSNCGVYADSAAAVVKTDTAAGVNPYRFSWKQLIVPGTLIGAGTVGMEAGWFKGLNGKVNPTDASESVSPTPVDDIIQYAPVAGIYALKLCGVPSRHDYVETSLILAMAWGMGVIAVQTAKHTFKVWRPDGSSYDSFPSGHSATAFMGAELLRREFAGTNPWIGYSGYAVAIATGALRVHHNRHWLTDVLAGAGIGILSARAAYWLYPVLTKHLLPGLYRRNVYLSACAAPGGMALSMQIPIGWR